MSTTNRLPSAIGVYHVILRGNNKQRIFEDREDYAKFLYVLGDYEALCGFTLFAYCLMSNHIHLLIKPGPSDLSNVIVRICVRFVRWYNAKYCRCGHLFQGRHKRKPVNSFVGLLAVARYIHQNPVKAGICSDPYQYEYSSFRNYFSNRLIDGEFVLTMISKEYFIEYNLVPNNDAFMDIDERPRKSFTDEQAVLIMQQVSGCANTAEFQTLDKASRDKALSAMIRSGISIRQASRITGISYTVIRRITGGS